MYIATIAPGGTVIINQTTGHYTLMASVHCTLINGGKLTELEPHVATQADLDGEGEIKNQSEGHATIEIAVQHSTPESDVSPQSQSGKGPEKTASGSS